VIESNLLENPLYIAIQYKGKRCADRGAYVEVEMVNSNKTLVPQPGKENNIVNLRSIRRRWKINIEVASVVQGAFRQTSVNLRAS
jgi:hypothetical protein